ncbi:flavin reductase [Clostridium polyendosporum]|uniref:Flavin reductase n=1 Tax=Clostridium polyendosporum TaxID=69208 RepID=A0A919RX90_9CLOT|nr:NAD(P)H-dependent oxidoreductase [Clostridium polyendosporum]GIM28152.1 flavin reductase [Clostridium polyendosporum]
MKILAIMGSPRKEGNTFLVTKMIEERLKQFDHNIQFNYLFLRDADIKMCLGCTSCFNKGEAHCPLKDDTLKIAENMIQSDGVIFACPTYVANVSGIMKNFIDRLAYICHRPLFYNKKALLVSTTGIAGLFQLFSSLSLAVSAWGFHITSKVGIVMGTNSIHSIPEKYFKQIDKAVAKFYKAVIESEKYSPSITSLTAFQYNQNYYRNNDESTLDAKFWREKGWLEVGKNYYVEARVNILKKIVARLITKILEINIAKDK